jgi:6-phospho-beta-glucosidase
MGDRRVLTPTCKLSVLGGGSPFTIALVDALERAAHTLRIDQLSLHGRSMDSLQRVAHYAEARLAPLGWTVACTTHLEESTEGSDFIVQQIRFGGLDGRASDEEAAWKFGLAADETLGPAAISCVLRTAPSLRRVGKAIARTAPDAWVLNLTNPLSITTALLEHEGVRHCLGICELPTTTATALGGILGRDVSALDWDYVGLNHRGFLVDLWMNGQDALARILERLGDKDFAGTPSSVIERLNAVPTKYFRLVLQPTRTKAPSRARFVAALRSRILAELALAPDRRPPSLARREMDWYDVSLVPLLQALGDPSGEKLIVNAMSERGLVEEGFAHVSTGGIRFMPSPRVPSAALERWLGIFRAHERALLAVAVEPTPSRILEAVSADPMIPPHLGREVAAHLSTVVAASA